MSDKFLKEAHVELTSYCNYKCSFCTNPFRKKIEGGTLEWSFFKDIVKQCVDAGISDISLHGSGESALYKSRDEEGNIVRVWDAIKHCKDQGLSVLINSNCFLFSDEDYEKIMRAGLDVLRVSFHGWDKDSYEKYMKTDGFDKVLSDMKKIDGWNKEFGTNMELHSTHLCYQEQEISIDEQTELYKKNVVDPVGCFAEVWQLHDWSGQMDTVHQMYTIRKKDERKRRSCGRPFSPSVEIRANGKISICCFDLGNPYYLGDLKENSLREIYFGEDYERVREAHKNEKWEEVSICNSCDQLYDFPDALYWTNIPGREYGQSKASGFNYIDIGV